MTPTTSNPDFGPEIAAMRQGVDYRIKVSVRGFSCLLRPLSMTEQVQVTGDAAAIVEELPAKLRHSLSEHTIYAKIVLKIASTSEPGAQDGQISDYILDRMTPEEIQFLWKQYVAVTDKVNPSLEKIPAERLHSLVEDIKKNGSSRLIELSFLESVNLLELLLLSDG